MSHWVDNDQMLGLDAYSLVISYTLSVVNSTAGNEQQCPLQAMNEYDTIVKWWTRCSYWELDFLHHKQVALIIL